MKLNWLLVTSFLFIGVLHARELPYANSVSNGFRRDARIETIEKSGNHTALIKSTEEQSPTVLRELEQTFQESESRVLIVSVDGKIIFEKYSSPFLAKWWTPLGFSMSKSVTALAVGQALCEGHISSLEDRIEAYVPELKGTSWGVASVEDVLKKIQAEPTQPISGTTGIRLPLLKKILEVQFYPERCRETSSNT